jgi:hypothetical protein
MGATARTGPRGGSTATPGPTIAPAKTGSGTSGSGSTRPGTGTITCGSSAIR